LLNKIITKIRNGKEFIIILEIKFSCITILSVRLLVGWLVCADFGLLRLFTFW
jgi:hypothetical protein